jgi:hypothetical protein
MLASPSKQHCGVDVYRCLESARALSILNKQFFDIATDIAGASKRWDKTFQAEVVSLVLLCVASGESCW